MTKFTSGDRRKTGTKSLGENRPIKGMQKEFKERQRKEPSYKELLKIWEKIWMGD